VFIVVESVESGYRLILWTIFAHVMIADERMI